ncbi:MAG: hypothetical protein NT126_12710 [Bacteroidetes bacterium]|nr:hypothetical protein [Bacteroidota bacterium]
MRAVIFPLSEYLYHFEKYDGSSRRDRFHKKYPFYLRFVNTKFGITVMVICFGIPIIVLVTAVYFLPVYFFMILKFGYKNSKLKMNKLVDDFGDMLDSISDKKRENIFQSLNTIQSDGFSIFVYYTPSMIPSKKKQRRKFFEKLDLMKEKLKIAHVREVQSKEDIETMIWLFDIDRAGYFLLNLELEFSNSELLIPLVPTPEISSEKKSGIAFTYFSESGN